MASNLSRCFARKLAAVSIDWPCGIDIAPVFQPIQQFGDLWPDGVELHVAKFVVSDRDAARRVQIQRDAGMPPPFDLYRIDLNDRHRYFRTPPTVTYGLKVEQDFRLAREQRRESPSRSRHSVGPHVAPTV